MSKHLGYIDVSVRIVVPSEARPVDLDRITHSIAETLTEYGPQYDTIGRSGLKKWSDQP